MRYWNINVKRLVRLEHSLIPEFINHWWERRTLKRKQITLMWRYEPWQVTKPTHIVNKKMALLLMAVQFQEGYFRLLTLLLFILALAYKGIHFIFVNLAQTNPKEQFEKTYYTSSYLQRRSLFLNLVLSCQENQPAVSTIQSLHVSVSSRLAWKVSTCSGVNFQPFTG